MIAIDIRELNYLKLLHPICMYFLNNNIPYTIVHYGMPRGDKEYNRSSVEKINKSDPRILAGARNVFSYNNDSELLRIVKDNNIKKFVGLEIYLNYNKILKSFKSMGTKVYSIQYFTDSVWSATADYYSKIDSVYFTSDFLMRKSIEYSGAKFDKDRHKFLGSPLYDQLEGVGKENNILVMLPNIRAEYVSMFFKSTDRFMKIIDGLSKKGNLIFKTRKKQWLPAELKKYSADIIFDSDHMYPSSIVNAFSKSCAVAMFYSSSVYESVMADKYVINIEAPLIYRKFNVNHINEYFSKENGSLYNFPDVVDFVSQDKIISGDFSVKELDSTKLAKWKDKFMGKCEFNSAELISKDILL